MATGKSPQRAAKDAQQAAQVIELSSDSESEGPGVEDEAPQQAPENQDTVDQPLLRAAGIKYKDDAAAGDGVKQLDQHGAPTVSNPVVRVRDTGSAKHRHVDIEIPLPTSSELRRRQAEADREGRQEANNVDHLKTPQERKHITFDDSDHEEFVTPREAPSRDPLESLARSADTGDGTRRDAEPAGKLEQEEEEEESDDEAPPEAVSTRAAEAETLKAAEAAARAAQQQATALRRKRQERDAFFKQQAEERKRGREVAQKDDEADDAPNNSTQESTSEVAEDSGRKVPKLLPLELLESDDEDESRPLRVATANGLHKRRKLSGPEQSLLREPRLPKDKRRGATAYRVMAASGDVRLAPKVRKQAVNLKETLLRRDRAAKARGGFFKKR